ncbi:MAG TPA: hypothetical protein VHK24_06595, partial [Steroidobacter sp.]|nr:hypothetical protein [Steroidobacter sp.]
MGPVERLLIVLAALATLATARTALALDKVEFTVKNIEGPAWRADEVAASVVLGSGAPRAELHIARLDLPGLQDDIRNVRIDCQSVEVSQQAYGCKGARVRLASSELGGQTITADLHYAREDGALDLKLAGVRLGGGVATGSLSLREHGWTMRLALSRAPVTALLRLAAQFGRAKAPFVASGGLADVTVAAHGSGRTVHEARFEGRVAQLGLSNDAGSLATDKLDVEIKGVVGRSAGGAAPFSLELRSRAGQAYAQPIFLDFGAHPLAAAARGVVDRDMRVILDSFSIDHSGVADAQGSAALDFRRAQPLRSLDLRLASLRFPGAYESYLQPLLLDTSYAAMRTSGALSGHIEVQEGAPRSIDLGFHQLTADDGARNFALRDLIGRWTWRAEDAQVGEDEEELSSDAVFSDLQWRGGLALGLELGAGRIRFSTRGRRFRLLEPARIPILDGALELQTLRIRSLGTPKVAFLVDATIQPISVARLCRSFGWPQFGGQVGGVISKLRMREGVITLGATLRGRVFDGAVSISDLRLEQPFGQWPRFHSSIELDNLDLDLVTRAFSFGRITGRLSGAIRNLQLFNWTPVAFDAQLYTPAEDRSRHRISQRAVQNIGSIGGSSAGVAAALSSGFMRFFDDFNYEKLGL